MTGFVVLGVLVVFGGAALLIYACPQPTQADVLPPRLGWWSVRHRR
jgi:hypothetical protein